MTAPMLRSPTTLAGTVIARSAKARRRDNGWKPSETICCRSPTITSSSPCRPRSRQSRSHNKTVVYDLLFRAAAETLIAIAANPKHLGARVGFTAVLHTWGSALTHHPHVHMIVPGGGLSSDGSRWIACKPRFFLPVRALFPARQGAVAPVPAAVSRRPRGVASGRAVGLLRRSRTPC